MDGRHLFKSPSLHGACADSGGRTYAGRGADERRAERRIQLIEAGTRAFGRDGYKGTTTRSLCAEAKLTQRYFYESFRDLEDLFIAVYRSHVGRLFAAVDAARAAAGPRPDQLVRNALNAYFLTLKADPHGAKIVLSEVLTVSRETEAMARETIDAFAKLLRTNLFETGKAVQLPGVDLHLLSIGLVGSGHHIAWTWMLNDFEESVESVVNTAMALYRLADNRRSRPGTKEAGRTV